MYHNLAMFQTQLDIWDAGTGGWRQRQEGMDGWMVGSKGKPMCLLEENTEKGKMKGRKEGNENEKNFNACLIKVNSCEARKNISVTPAH